MGRYAPIAMPTPMEARMPSEMVLPMELGAPAAGDPVVGWVVTAGEALLPGHALIAAPMSSELAGNPTLITTTGAMDAWLNLLGRLHPLMVHFPLALAVVAAVVELWRALRRHDGPSPFAVTALWFAAAGGVAAACSGWANAAYGGESTSVDLFIHRWGGVAVAALLVTLAIAGTTASRAGHAGWSGIWRMGLVLCAGVVAAVGHFGGNLVHGEGYVTRALWAALRASAAAPEASSADEASRPMAAAIADQEVAASYSALLPIFESRCFECHGRGKSKAGIRLDDPASLVGQQRKGRTIVTPRDPDASSLLAVLTLPIDDELAMPPEGERLSADEVAKVRAWIAAGAPVPAAAK